MDTPREHNVVCAWCDKSLYHNPALPAGAISHGICSPCHSAFVTGVDSFTDHLTGSPCNTSYNDLDENERH